jgi:phage I-like protein
VLVLKALGLVADAGEAEVLGAIHTLKMRPDADLAAEVAALKQRELDRETNDLIAVALKDGRLAPAQEASARQFAADNFSAFKGWLAAAPVVVPLKDLGLAGNKERAGAGGINFTPKQIAICEAWGNNPAEIAKLMNEEV